MAALSQRARQVVSTVARTVQRKEEKRPSYQASAEERVVLKMVESGKRVRLATLEAFEPIWTKEILFVAGIQHLRFISATRQFEPVRQEDWVPLPVFNFCQAKVERIVDFFTRHKPIAEVLRNTDSEADRRAAKLAEMIRQHLWDLTDDASLIDEAATWMVTTGNAFKKNFISRADTNEMDVPAMSVQMEPQIDESTGQPRINPMTGEPIMVPRYVEQRDESGQVVMQKVQDGEVASYVVGPMSMTVPLAAETLEDAPWIMETSLVPLERLRSMFPEKADFIPKQAQIVTSDLYQHRLTSLLTSGLHGVIRSLDPYTLDGYGIVHKYELRPDVDFKNGLSIIELDGIPLSIDELPLGNQYSYTHFGYHRVPGRFWWRGAVEDMLHPQEQINKLEQFLQLNDAFNSNPMWLVPTSANIAEGAIRNKPGLVVRYNYPFKPEAHEGVSMPAQIVQRRASYIVDMEEISQTRAVTMGGAPPGVTAGVALNKLAEEAESMFGPIEKRFERSIERDQTKKLRLVQRWYRLPRLLVIRGTKGGSITEIQDFIGMMLRGNTQVRVEAGSDRPRSKAGQQQMLFDALQFGLLPGVYSDADQHAEFLRRIGVSGFEAPESLDYKRARWENEMLSRTVGWEQVQRQSADNDVIHLMVHTDYRKTDEWLRLPQVVRMRHMMHEVEHLIAVIKAGGETGASSIEPIDEDLEPAGSGGGGSPDEDQEPGEGQRPDEMESGMMEGP